MVAILPGGGDSAGWWPFRRCPGRASSTRTPAAAKGRTGLGRAAQSAEPPPAPCGGGDRAHPARAPPRREGRALSRRPPISGPISPPGQTVSDPTESADAVISPDFAAVISGRDFARFRRLVRPIPAGRYPRFRRLGSLWGVKAPTAAAIFRRRGGRGGLLAASPKEQEKEQIRGRAGRDLRSAAPASDRRSDRRSPASLSAAAASPVHLERRALDTVSLAAQNRNWKRKMRLITETASPPSCASSLVHAVRSWPRKVAGRRRIRVDDSEKLMTRMSRRLVRPVDSDKSTSCPSRRLGPRRRRPQYRARGPARAGFRPRGAPRPGFGPTA